MNIFNSSVKELRSNVDIFDNGNIHYLNTKIPNNGETTLAHDKFSSRNLFQSTISGQITLTPEPGNDTNMKVLSRSKLGITNTTVSEKNNARFMRPNYDVIFIFTRIKSNPEAVFCTMVHDFNLFLSITTFRLTIK